jgi:hypothetical protein
MQELIQFMEFSKNVGGRGRRLADNTISIWYNIEKPDSKKRVYASTIANNVRTEKKFVKIGKLGDDLVIVFTNEPDGIRINGSIEKRKNLVFHSKGFVEYIFPELKNVDHKQVKDRKVFRLIPVSSDVYKIEKK